MDDKIRKAGKYDEYAHQARKIRKGIARPNLDKSGKRIGESTHIMTSANIDNRNVAFPTLFPHKTKANMRYKVNKKLAKSGRKALKKKKG